MDFLQHCHCNFIYKGTISIAMLELPNKNMDSFGVFCVMPCCHAPVQLVVTCICAHSQLHLIIVCVGTKPFFKIIFSMEIDGNVSIPRNGCGVTETPQVGGIGQDEMRDAWFMSI